MKITADFTRLHKGESGRLISFSLSEEHRGKKVKMGFLTPLGRTYFTDSLPCESGEGSFVIEEALTDARGILLCQLFLSDEKGEYLIKSPVSRFYVASGIDDSGNDSAPDIRDSALTIGEKGAKNADYSGLYTASFG